MTRAKTERGWHLLGGAIRYFNILGSNIYIYICHQLMKLSFSFYISKAKSMRLSLTYPLKSLFFCFLFSPFRDIFDSHLYQV